MFTGQRVLLIQLRQLGDILLTTPCCRAIKQLGAEKLVFLSHPMGHLALRDNPDIDLHLTYSSRSVKETWQTVKKLRKEGLSLAVDFMNNPRSAIFCRLSGAPRRLGFRSARRWAYNETYPRHPSGAYIVHEKLALMGIADVDRYQEVVHRFRQEDAALAVSFYSSMAEGRPRVILSPTHRRSHRRWPLESFCQLADTLVKDKKAQVIWIWGPGEETMIDTAIKLCTQATYKAPRTNFWELSAMIQGADFFVANSNGPSHLAVAHKIPSLQLHGHTDGRSWCPNLPHSQFIQSPSFFSPGETVLDDISVASVWEKLCEIWPLVETRIAARSINKSR